MGHSYNEILFPTRYFRIMFSLHNPDINLKAVVIEIRLFQV